MSDFFSGGWSIFITATTLVSLAACLLLLWVASRRQPMGWAWRGPRAMASGAAAKRVAKARSRTFRPPA